MRQHNYKLLWCSLLLLFLGSPEIESQNLLYSKTYGGGGEELGQDLIRTRDNNLLFVGTTSSFSSENGKIFLYKVDDEGTIIWHVFFGECELISRVRVIELSDSNIVVLGKGYNPKGNKNTILFQFDAQGNKLWEKFISREELYQASDIIESSNKEILIIGSSQYSSNYPIKIIRISPNGEIMGSREIGYWQKETFSRDIIKSTNGGYLIVGWYSTIPPEEEKTSGYLLRLNEDLTEKWHTIHGENYGDVNNSVYETNDGSFVTLGTSYELGGDFTQNIHFNKFDSDGNLQWSQAYFDAEYKTNGRDVKQDSNGDYYLLGRTSDNDDILLIKTDEDGNEISRFEYGGLETESAGAMEFIGNNCLMIFGSTEYEVNGVSDFLLLKLSVDSFTIRPPIFDTDEIKVFPNPIFENAGIQLENVSQFKQLLLFSATGKLAAEFELQRTNELRVEGLASGVYNIVGIKKDNSLVTKQLVIL